MSETSSLGIVLLQQPSPLDEPATERIERVLSAVRDAAGGADLVMLPELWPTGYFAFDRYAAEATTLDGDLVASLRDVARTTRCNVFAGSFLERTPAGIHNTSLLVDRQGEISLVYRKFHLFGLAASREADLLVPGDDLAVVETDMGVVAAMTCYDLRFPELARALTSRGAHMVLVAAAWPAARVDPWRVLVRARAIENQVYVVACNAAGDSGGAAMAGHSMVVDPWGAIVTELGDGPGAGHATIDLGAVESARSLFPVLDDRRLQLEGGRRG